jgi:hypothetical protein
MTSTMMETSGFWETSSRLFFDDDRLIEVTCVFGKVPRSRPQSAAAAR